MKIFTQKIEFDDKAILLHIQGRLSSKDCTAINQTAQNILKSGVFNVIAVMDKAASFPSPVVGQLMQCRSEFKSKGGDLVLTGLGDGFRQKLAKWGADKVLQIFSDPHVAYNRYSWNNVDSEQSLKIFFPPRMTDVPVLRTLLSQVAKQKGYDEKDTFRIEAIVDEVINNAIEHGHPGQDEITLQYSIDKKKIEFLVKNKTQLNKAEKLKFFLKRSKPAISTEAESGRGLSLVKLISNAINVSLDNTGTLVRVMKLREEKGL